MLLAAVVLCVACYAGARVLIRSVTGSACRSGANGYTIFVLFSVVGLACMLSGPFMSLSVLKMQIPQCRTLSLNTS